MSAMISKRVINTLYKKYAKPPRDFSDLHIDDFMTVCGELYGVEINDVSITFSRMAADSPFHTILLSNIYGKEIFESHIALIFSTYILFFNRERYDITVHFKPDSCSWLRRLYWKLRYWVYPLKSQ